jgi:hypothetical protein
MTNARPSEIGAQLRERLESAGHRLGTRESAQREAVAEAQQRAETLHAATAFALEGFHEAASHAGAPHLEVELSPLRVDDKHIRSIEFELRRGRYVAIVTVKSRGEVTLVGPFHAGKTEGPCMTFPYGAEDELVDALGAFLEKFVEEAATP